MNKLAADVPWWKGPRGEWYAVAQIPFFALVVFGPRTCSVFPVWVFPFTVLGSIGGCFMLLFGGLLVGAGILKLGENLSPLPYPKEPATLVETGAYKLVRHPMYSGAIFMALGWALWSHGWLTIGYAAILFVFFDVKSRREERWLQEKFPGYAAYQKRVRKLIPYLY